MTYEFIVKNFANNLFVFFLLTTYKSYSSTNTVTEGKYKTKIEKQDSDFDVQCAKKCKETCRLRWKWRLGNRHWKGSRQKEKRFLHFVMDSKNLAHATKSGYNVQNVSCGLAKRVRGKKSPKNCPLEKNPRENGPRKNGPCKNFLHKSFP